MYLLNRLQPNHYQPPFEFGVPIPIFGLSLSYCDNPRENVNIEYIIDTV